MLLKHIACSPRLCLMLPFTILVGSCDTPVTTAARESTTVAASSARVPRTYDDLLLQIAEIDSGFAGYALDESGELYLLATESADSGQLRAALRQARSRGISAASEAEVNRAHIRRVRYGFRALHDAYRQSLSILSEPGVTQIDIDEEANLVVLGAADARTAARSRGLVADRGLSDIVRVEIIPASEMLQSTPSLRTRVRPVPAGVQIQRAGSQSICTLGFNAYFRDNLGQYDGHRYFLTAAHCTATVGSADSSVFGQPVADSTIGYEISDPPLFNQSQNASCPSGYLCRFSDAALLRWYTNLGAAWRFGEFPTVGGSAPFNITGYRKVMYTAPPWDPSMAALYAGVAIQKLGRTTGRTTGTIKNTCVTVRQYESVSPTLIGTNRYMICQFQALNLASGPGDSGAPVYRVDATGDMNPAVGLLWGKSIEGPVVGGPIRTTFSWLPLATAELSAGMGGGWLEFVYPMWGVPGYW